jgi:hypothetical protein
MKASAAVTAVAVVLVLGSLTILTGVVAEFVSAVSICRNTGQPLTDLLTPRVSMLGFLPAMFSLLGLAAAVGLLFAREWARRTTLFLALAPFVVYLPIVVFRPAMLFTGRQTSVRPPSTAITWPVTKSAVAKYITASAISSPDPVRCNGTRLM